MPAGPLQIGTIVNLIFWMAILTGLVLVGILVVRRFRDSTAEDQHEAPLSLSKLQEMVDEGDISQQDYRKIKSVLGARLRQGINEDKRKG
jgi:uncharacterized membrane protein